MIIKIDNMSNTLNTKYATINATFISFFIKSCTNKNTYTHGKRGKKKQYRGLDFDVGSISVDDRSTAAAAQWAVVVDRSGSRRFDESQPIDARAQSVVQRSRRPRRARTYILRPNSS